MRRAYRWVPVLAVATAIALTDGCSVNSDFVYRPNPPSAADRKLPAKVAVLPFADGTEDFAMRNSFLSGSGQYNLAKAGIPGGIAALPPEFWGKAFADELAASDSFRSARFIYSVSELKDEAYVVEGTLRKALFWSVNPGTGAENEILVSFRAMGRSDKRLAWEKEVERKWQTPTGLWAGCAASKQCYSDKVRDHWNEVMGGVLAEARKDLVATIASLSEGGTGDGAGARTGGPAAGESLDRTIESILKGK